MWLPLSAASVLASISLHVPRIAVLTPGLAARDWVVGAVGIAYCKGAADGGGWRLYAGAGLREEESRVGSRMRIWTSRLLGC
jgi:hypothetical protein